MILSAAERSLSEVQSKSCLDITGGLPGGFCTSWQVREAETGGTREWRSGSIRLRRSERCRHTIRWRKEYGGLKLEQAKRLEELERENSGLKRLVAELSQVPRNE
jgi:hypothetical protein